MQKKIFLLVFCLLLLSGCVTVPKYYALAKEGYTSQEGQTIGAAVATAGAPLVGEPWAAILGHIASAVIGGAAVYKRKKWKDEKPPAV